jgi:hypothetical protein
MHNLPKGRRRAARVVALTVVLVLGAPVAWGIWAYRVLGHPALDQPTPADAVVVLGPVQENGSLRTGRELVDRGLADRLLVSVTPDRRGRPGGRMCRGLGSDAGTGQVTCFVPDPATTRGEARTVAELARRNDWNTVIVVTPSYHVERARTLFRRCFAGRLELVSPPVDLGTRQWIFQAVYQSAAFVKAALEGGC